MFNCGQYINLETNILNLNNTVLADGSYPQADWRVLKKDENGIWLILADYLPQNKLPNGINEIIASSNSNYGFKKNGSWDDFINGMKKADWINLLYESNIKDKNGVEVYGGVSGEQWCESWNFLGYDTLTASRTSENHYEYNCSGHSNWQGTSILTGGNSGTDNTLLFPRRSNSNNDGYMLRDLGSHNKCTIIEEKGSIGDYWGDAGEVGVRPCVYIPNDTLVDTTVSVWTLVN